VSGFLLDTNVVSELVRHRPNPRVCAWIESTREDLLYVSVLTIGELWKGIESVRDASRRVVLESWLASGLIPRFDDRILPVDEAVASRWGRLAGQSVARRMLLPVIDGLLAATAMHYNLTLVTRNVKDVAGTGVPIFDPWREL
jgi:predicted nucleic acid-binding protein